MMTAEIFTCIKKETLELFPHDLQPFPLDEYFLPPPLSLSGEGGGGGAPCVPPPESAPDIYHVSSILDLFIY